MFIKKRIKESSKSVKSDFKKYKNDFGNKLFLQLILLAFIFFTVMCFFKPNSGALTYVVAILLGVCVAVINSFLRSWQARTARIKNIIEESETDNK